MTVEAVLLLLAIASHDPVACSQPDLVTLEGSDIAITDALHSIAEQGSINMAVRKGFRGRVSATLRCVEPRVALRLILAQVDGAYCEEDGSTYIDRADRIVCTGLLTVPPAVQYVAHQVE